MQMQSWKIKGMLSACSHKVILVCAHLEDDGNPHKALDQMFLICHALGFAFIHKSVYNCFIL